MASSSTTAPGDLLAGTARIRSEYLLSAPDQVSAPPDDDAAEAGDAGATALPNDSRKRKLSNGNEAGPSNETESPEAEKKVKLSGAQRKKLAKQQKKERGMNKNRKFGRVSDEVKLCWKTAVGEECQLGERCQYSHDVAGYLAIKPKDIYFPSSESLTPNPPFVLNSTPNSESEATSSSIVPGTTCPVFAERGYCNQGFKCRFLGGHVTVTEGAAPALVVDEERRRPAPEELNVVQMNTVKNIRSRQFPTPIVDQYLAELDQEKEEKDETPLWDDEGAGAPNGVAPSTNPIIDSSNDSPDVPMTSREKKRLRWQGLTYLAPLTTVGNLPFRRLCVDYGADITCGEMALATSLLGGNREEWSLIKRHPSERKYGIQLAGNKPTTLGRISEMLAKELGPTGKGVGALGAQGGIDFVDVNCGCPIDLVYKSGAGSALLDVPNRLGKILRTMDRALGEIPLTIKVRTGVKEGKNSAHKLMPKLDGWGVSAITGRRNWLPIHGRTRQQRYTKSADWGYIKQCVDQLRISSTNDEGDDHPIPIFGGGDVYTSAMYWDALEQSGVDGIMLGRGPLIKPWLFTEIKERREWDISSRERLDMIRKYAEYGLNHWGSDTQGVNTTRRYLCEALSFQSRYIPLGILESLPRMNDRPPRFRGRDELETLLSSGNSQDWVKISEMFLGPPPEGWDFIPKHKSNAYGSEEGNG